MESLADVGMFDSFLVRFKPIFTIPQFGNFIHYAKGIISAAKKNVSSIASTGNYTKNQSTLNRFLTESPWRVDALNRRKYGFLKEKIGRNNCCFVSIDDTLFEKTGKKIELASKLFDHCKKDYIFGHCLVTSHIICGFFQSPLTFRHYQNKNVCVPDEFKTKIELAMEIIDECIRENIGDYYLIDSWYFASSLAEHVHDSGKKYIAMSKSNRKIMFNEQWTSLRDIQFDKIEPMVVGKYRCIELVSQMKGLRHNVRIVCTKKVNKTKKWKFIVTNDIESPIEFIIESYAKRWSIEVLHKDLKNNLGINDYQMRKRYGFIKHWTLIFLVCFILYAMKSESRTTQAKGTVGKIVGYLKNLFCLDWIMKLVNEGVEHAKEGLTALVANEIIKNAKV
jgi:hypothetical protein